MLFLSFSSDEKSFYTVFAFFADYTLIHIFKPKHTHYTLTVDTPVQAYIYMLIQSVIDTYI